MSEINDSGFVLAESVARSTFDEDIYAHLGALASVEFSRPGSPAQDGSFVFNASKYEALEQAAFEEAPRMEAEPPRVVDWAQLDQAVSAFEGALAESLRRAPYPGDSRVFVEFSAKCYENFRAYQQMYPENGPGRSGNPWARTMRLLRFGRLLAIGDPSRLPSGRGPRKGKRSDVVIESAPQYDRSNILALVKGAAAQPTPLPIDERFSIQAKLLAFLKTSAKGHENRVALKDIAAHLSRNEGIQMTVPMIQVKLTVPLKRSGAIGSNNKGFFFIESEEDLIQSYCFHLTKVKSARRIMRRYQARAWEINSDLNLEDACGGNGPVLNPKF